MKLQKIYLDKKHKRGGVNLGELTGLKKEVPSENPHRFKHANRPPFLLWGNSVNNYCTTVPPLNPHTNEHSSSMQYSAGKPYVLGFKCILFWHVTTT